VLSLLSIALVYLAYLMLMRELKKRIIVQNELEYNIEALQRSNAELEQFAYVASHDLQEPLRKIQTFGNRLILKHIEDLDDDAKFIIERMQSAAERMQILINDLLTYSRIVNTGSKKFERTDLTRALENVLDVLSESISQKEAKITYDKLPVVIVNQTQMEQLFQNLLTNALKFVQKNKKPVIEIKYSLVEGKQIPNVKIADEFKSFHKISIIDNGIGFDEQYADKIFVIFQRLQGKTEYAGTGIGLAMCKKIVLNHEGYITAKSKLNKGSEFTVYLPR
jgi:light-regulated signal transduction histidine kinase (bacteriophytochrome)